MCALYDEARFFLKNHFFKFAFQIIMSQIVCNLCFSASFILIFIHSHKENRRISIQYILISKSDIEMRSFIPN